MSTVTEGALVARAAPADPPGAVASLAARERFDRALAGRERELTPAGRLIMSNVGGAPALDETSVPACSETEGGPAEAAQVGVLVGAHASAGTATAGDCAMAQSLAPADADAPSACESAGSASSPVDEFTDPEAAPLDAAPAAGLVAPQPVAGGVAPTSAGSAVEVTAVTASGSGMTAAAATPGDGGGSLGQPALHAGASVHGAAAPPVHAAGAPEMPAFADLVARYRETWTEAAAGSDGAAAGGWGASPGQPLLDPAGQPAGTGSPSTSPPEAVRLAEFLLRQAPLAGSPGDPVQMIFPQGSGPIDQIVFMRDARGLFMVVSSQSGSREAVQRGLGELERRLRERGIAVGGIRLADPVASAQDRAEGGEG